MSKNKVLPLPVIFDDPTEKLKQAISKLDLFTKPEATSLDIAGDGALLATQQTPLEKIKEGVKHLIGSFFSSQIVAQREQKIGKITNEVLTARDTIQSLVSLIISKLHHGNEAEKKMATYALNTIKKYNALIEKDKAAPEKYTLYNFDRNKILLDPQVKGQCIEISPCFTFLEKSSLLPVQKSFQYLGNAFLNSRLNSPQGFNPTYKKDDQFMIDTFLMKAIRLIESDSRFSEDIVEMIKAIRKTKIQVSVRVENGSEFIDMYQIVSPIPGRQIVLEGSFKKMGCSDLKLMQIPTLTNLKVDVCSFHTGFPEPAQYIGWALSEILVEANPLRSFLSPLFQKLNKQRKDLLHALLNLQSVQANSEKNFRSKTEVFNQNKQKFLKLHRSLQEAILKSGSFPESKSWSSILQELYDFAGKLASPYAFLEELQKKINQLFVKDLFLMLEKEWLESKDSVLRKSNPHEKLQEAVKLLDKQVENTLTYLEKQPSLENAYISLMGQTLSQASKKIILQYFSEKMEFIPPLLNEFEQKIQASAFLQQISFLEEIPLRTTEVEENLTTFEVKMQQAFEDQIKIFQLETIEEFDHLSTQIVLELERYFFSRHSSKHSRKSDF